MDELEKKIEELNLISQTVKGSTWSMYPINSRGQKGFCVYLTQKRMKFKGDYLESAVQQAIDYIKKNKRTVTNEEL